ncbi:RHS repeat-associated core domain-containing protein [Sorangium cellulosum]|uniref:RHS repeat-associated core domain-containing protein n=1 Tax=Sorangium cellulosum TaxID=56 RepID=UPI0013EC5AC6|nr:RHS repeat-associated core domain-containing protein [Sorangium cellulosum]
MTRFVWDGDVLVHEITRRVQAEGDPVVQVKTYCFEDDGFAPVAHCEDGRWFHYVNDPIGTPERLVDARGEVACELRREAWGRTEAAPGARTTTAIRFPGQYEDAETGLCYNRFRYYDPDAGRFVSSDPIGLDGGTNGWTYANNPIGWIDAYGLISADHDRIAHGGYYTRKAKRRAAHTGTLANYTKHKKARGCAEAATMSANNGNAQYDPSANPGALEREALRKGTVTRGNPITDHNFHALHRFDSPIGYADGEPTRWLRAEYSSGFIHGHPPPLSDVRKLIPGADP